jgi:parallel beta-helix repeat protein
VRVLFLAGRSSHSRNGANMRVFWSICAVLYCLSTPYFLHAQTKRSLLQEDVGYVNAGRYNGGAFTQATIAAALADIGANSRTLFLPSGTWPITSNLTIPVNVHLYVPKSTAVTIASGITLTIAGGIGNLTAYPGWYTGLGKVALGASTAIVDLQRDFDVKCDGSTNDTPAIQAAFNAITAPNVVAQFPAGTCLVATTVNGHSNMTLQGRGAGVTTIKQPDLTQMAATGLIAFPTGTTNVTISGITFDGNMANQGTIVTHAFLVYFTNARDIRIMNNEFKNGYGGVPPDAGAMLVFGGASVHGYVMGNHFHDSFSTGESSSDCFYFSGFDIHTIGNTFENCSDTGSGVESTSTDASNPADNIAIVGNTYTGCRQSIGISSAVAGTYVNGVVISGNFIEGANSSAAGAIYFYPVNNIDSFNRIKNVAITGNVVRGTTLGYPIFVFNGSNITVANNIVSLAGQIGANNSYSGIFIGKSDHVLVANNISSDNGNAGINVQGSTDITLQGNFTNGNGLARTLGSRFGILLGKYDITNTQNENIRVMGNVGTGQDHGFVAQDTINNLALIHNDFRGNVGDAMSIAVTVIPRYYGNLTHGPGGGAVLESEEQAGMVMLPCTFSQLSGGTQGTYCLCVDCNVADPCTGGGAGAFAYRHPAGKWVCR